MQPTIHFHIPIHTLCDASCNGDQCKNTFCIEGPAIVVLKWIRDMIHYSFSKEEMDDLLFDLGVQRDDIAGSTAYGRAREITEYFRRRNQLQHLIFGIQKHRPWLDLREIVELVPVSLINECIITEYLRKKQMAQESTHS